MNLTQGMLQKLTQRELSPFNSISDQDGVSQILECLQSRVGELDQLIKGICQSIEETVDVNEFKDLSENILRSYEDTSQDA
jgi:archaellum component FlaC